MSLRRTSTISNNRPFYYIYLHNLPNRYLTSNIFPQVILSQQIREDIIEQEMHINECFCWFGFKTKQISCKFEKQMAKLMPSFVIIARRQVEIPEQLKEEKEYYDNHSNFNFRSIYSISSRSFDSQFNKTINPSLQLQTQKLSQSQSQSSQSKSVDQTKESISNDKQQSASSGFFAEISRSCGKFLIGSNFFEFLWKK